MTDNDQALLTRKTDSMVNYSIISVDEYLTLRIDRRATLLQMWARGWANEQEILEIIETIKQDNYKTQFSEVFNQIKELLTYLKADLNNKDGRFANPELAAQIEAKLEQVISL